MSSHNSEAAYASAEIASMIQYQQNHFFNGIGTTGAWSLFAGREGGCQWPLADGVISATNPNKQLNIAFEFKRINEGVHGILTALGQSYAYLEKGYDASVMCIPGKYSSHNLPGEHVKRIIESTAPDIPIWIFVYDEPDLSATRPFQGKLTCVRDITLASCRTIQRSVNTTTSASRVTTLWAHVREGMSHPDAFFRFCQCVKIVSSTGESLDMSIFPQQLIDAVRRIDPNANIFKYLSNTSSDNILDMAWRKVWFSYYFWKDLIPVYTNNGVYVVNDVTTKIKIDHSTYQKLFSGRVDSIKNKLVDKLNNGTITENEAWEYYAKKVRKDAHSYREVIDSGLYHIGFLSPNGELTDLGYKYVDACERSNSAYQALPMEILRGAVLQNGQFAALLHYIFKLSEERFDNDLYSFSAINNNGRRTFKHEEYLQWLLDYFANTLHIVQQSSLRAGGTRKPLQAEISFMSKLGLIRSSRYRIGSGLCIDWPQVETSLQFFNNL
ncbi:MAG: hypothetical protein IKZ12_01245 [Alistipes sp.]|nr:hypothetical protein [Alistipes sp.]